MVKYTNRSRSEHKELDRLLPGPMNAEVQGYLLSRGSLPVHSESDQVLQQSGYDYEVSKLTAILKRMADDSMLVNDSSACQRPEAK